MFRRRRLRSIAMVALLSGLLGGSLAQAQPLGFTIDPTQGFPGDTVTGQVNPSDVAASCVTDLAGLQAEFQAVFTGPFADGGTTGDLFNTFFPSGQFVFDNLNQTAYSLTGLTVLGIGSNVGGAAETALPQTFVMTFADLATQQPLGPLGHFDPVTGVGSVVVPNLAPGSYPVVATCVRPTLDVATLAAGIRKNGAFLQSIGAPADLNSPEFQQFVESFIGPGADIFAFLNAIGPTLVQNIVTPGALGVQFFTILQQLGHFQCYGLRNAPFDKIPVTLDDQFGSLAVTVRKARALCAPAPPGSAEGAFLTDYSITRGGPAARVPGQTVVNEFGTLTVDVLTPRSLLVPTAYSDTGPPSPIGAFVDHFTCYDVRITNGTPRFAGATVTVETALETATIQVQRPRRLCVPTDKNGEDPTAPSFPASLLCYQTRGKGGVSGTAFLNNQFGQQVYRLGNRQQMCVPSLLNPPPTTTTTSTTSTTSTTRSTTSTTGTTTSTTETTTSTTETTTSTTVTTTTSEPTTTTTSSTTTTTMGSPSGAFLEDAPSALE